MLLKKVSFHLNCHHQREHDMGMGQSAGYITTCTPILDSFSCDEDELRIRSQHVLVLQKDVRGNPSFHRFHP